jgi:hypothetical protein
VATVYSTIKGMEDLGDFIMAEATISVCEIFPTKPKKFTKFCQSTCSASPFHEDPTKRDRTNCCSDKKGLRGWKMLEGGTNGELMVFTD